LFLSLNGYFFSSFLYSIQNSVLNLLAKKYDTSGKNYLSFRNLRNYVIVVNNIADSMATKNNVVISFKDMSHTTSFAVLMGLQFTSFIIQFYTLLMDLLIIDWVQSGEIYRRTSASK
jgi:hypothetical protein